jgi:hypothetical protein
MLADWRPIEHFPNYSVSVQGTIRNEETGRQMTMLVNQHGVVNVGLTRNRRQYKRAVGLLVAHAFLEDLRPGPLWTCPINRDGNRFNNSVENLLWRPKWFAVKYFQQLEEPHFEEEYPIMNVDTHEYFDNPWEAVRTYGLLQVDLLLGIANQTPVWPTRDRFCEAS